MKILIKLRQSDPHQPYYAFYGNAPLYQRSNHRLDICAACRYGVLQICISQCINSAFIINVGGYFRYQHEHPYGSANICIVYAKVSSISDARLKMNRHVHG